MDVRSLIIDARQAKICELLSSTEMPITRVLEEAGCSVASSVLSSFKKRFGMTMREYRKCACNPISGGVNASSSQCSP